MRARVVFSIRSFWHAGLGGGSGDLDAAVVRDAAGLPYLPGRTVKGLLRDATHRAERAGAFERGTTEEWFGTPIAPTGRDDRIGALESARYGTVPGRLRFESAVLRGETGDADDFQRWARQHPDLVRHLYQTYASTALEGGVAKAGSLRVTEVVIPLDLEAEVEGPDNDDKWLHVLDVSAPLLRALGSLRNRGLGRVRVYIKPRPTIGPTQGG